MSSNKIIPYAENDVRAIKAVIAGVATDGQQKDAMNCIINDICKFYSDEIDAGEQTNITYRNLGKRSVALEIMRIASMDIDKLKQGTK